MENEKIENLINKLVSSLEGMSKTISLAFPPNFDGKPDPLGREKQEKERREEEKIQNLFEQISEVKKQTNQMKWQSRFLLGALVVAIAGLSFNIFLQIKSSDNKKNNFVKLEKCLNEVEKGKYIGDSMERIKQEKKEECFKKYPQ